MADELKQSEVFQGSNEIRINQATMNKIIEDWICSNFSGGPYKVTAVTHEKNGYSSEQFKITFDKE